MPRISLFVGIALLFALAGCDGRPIGLGDPPPGVSQAEWEAQIVARNRAQRQSYSRPRGGAR